MRAAKVLPETNIQNGYFAQLMNERDFVLTTEIAHVRLLLLLVRPHRLDLLVPLGLPLLLLPVAVAPLVVGHELRLLPGTELDLAAALTGEVPGAGVLRGDVHVELVRQAAVERGRVVAVDLAAGRLLRGAVVAEEGAVHVVGLAVLVERARLVEVPVALPAVVDALAVLVQDQPLVPRRRGHAIVLFLLSDFPLLPLSPKPISLV